MNRLSRFKEKQFNTPKDFEFLKKLDAYFNSSLGSNIEKLQNFSKYVPRQDLTNFLARYEIFKKILNVPGSIVECGVLFGGGLRTPTTHFAETWQFTPHEYVGTEIKVENLPNNIHISPISPKYSFCLSQASNV